MKPTKTIYLIPVMFCFFAMGFVDLVGIASNYVKSDLGLSDSVANVFPSLVFFWFLIFSVPTGMLMNRIGRKNTVLLSLAVTAVSLVLPLFGESFAIMLLSFSLLGIGNTLMQTSLNPLISTVIRGDNLASTLTFGQFIKAIASFLAPYIAMWGATGVLPSLGMGWRVLFLVYFVAGVLATLLLLVTPIKEEAPAGKVSGFGDCLRLLGKPIVLLSFLGIMCHVGIDVGTNTTAPKLLIERLGMSLNDAAFATSLYFIFRTAGCLTGFTHTLLTVICYYISGDRTSFTGGINDLYDISVIFSTRCFTFRKPDPLSDNLSFPVDTTSKCRLRSRNHLIRKTVSFFLQSSGIRKLGNFIQYFMFYF